MAAAFLYCIGAAKAGTTWLSRALRAHPQATLPPLKETHYFDSLEQRSSIWALDQMIRVRTEVRAERAQTTADAARLRLDRRVQEIDRWIGLVGSQRRNDTRYQTLMQRQIAPHHKLVADVTPAYALLSQTTYARMAGLNGGHTRFLMILRDPLDRLLSNISMTATRRAQQGGTPAAIRDSIIADVLADHRNAERGRSDYATTLHRLEAAVPADQRLVLFFEDLFSAKTLMRLSQFLGLDPVLSGPAEKVNAGTPLDLNPTDCAQLLTMLRPQYEAVAARFDPLPDRWQHNLAQAVVTA
ncbi:MAG: sulfotransferase [Pseudomonadota bacterium]